MSDVITILNKYNLNATLIEDIQNSSLFIISIVAFLSYLNYNLQPIWYQNIDNEVIDNFGGGAFSKPYDILLPFVVVHASIDFFINKSYDLKLHHLCVIGIYFYNMYNNVSTEYRFMFLYPLLNTEISSIFYVLKFWLPNKSFIYNLNTILFYLSFFKFRIYDFYYKIIQNNFCFYTIFQKYSNSDYSSYVLLLSCYILYILNIYWFLIMNKILYKIFAKNINTDKICHLLCSYMHWVNIPLSFYIYSYKPNEKYLFDIIGITILTISSYKYHYDIYTRLHDKQIEEYNIPTKDNIKFFINDIICINIRSFLVVATNYYYSENVYPVLIISSLFHITSIYQCTINILNLLIDYDKTKEIFLNYNNIFMGISIACDTLLIFMNSQTKIAIPFLLINITIGLLFIVEPFYKLTHAGFHILLIAQNYYMCLSSSSK